MSKAGVSYAFSEDYRGKVLTVRSKDDNTVTTGSLDFFFLDRHVWALGKDCKTVGPMRHHGPFASFKVVEEWIDSCSGRKLHPAIEYGLEWEASRILPIISPSSLQAFCSFVKYLSDEYNLTSQSEKQEKMVSFCDDIGPDLLALVNHKPVILPEIPFLYKAPKLWREMMWNINNCLVSVSNKSCNIILYNVPERLKWCSSREKGLYLYHIARCLLYLDAMEKDPDAALTMSWIENVKQGIELSDIMRGSN
jgi:hypothetical protein